ncbi:MAG: hypothetical protein KDC45_05425, partial [Bacteroidetes bacterium]|nr:hypothetical protein [Bacteroidota bacterium]
MAHHLWKEENTEKIAYETYGGVGDRQDIEDTLVDMQLLTKLTKGQTGIFHVAINPREEETLNEEEKRRAIEMIEALWPDKEGKGALSGQQRFHVDHVKDGRTHSHVFWSMVLQDEGKLIDLKLYKRRLQECAVEMEKEFGHEPVPRTPSKETLEISNADRMRETAQQKAKDRKKEISRIWEQTSHAQAFIEEARKAGYEIAKGDKCRFLVLDHDGQAFNLARDLPKTIRVKQIAERFGALEQELVSVEMARQRQLVFDREQQEIQQQHRMLDASDRAASLQAEQDKKLRAFQEKQQRAGTPKAKPEKPIILPSNDHLQRHDQLQKWSAIAGQRKKEF